MKYLYRPTVHCTYIKDPLLLKVGNCTTSIQRPSVQKTLGELCFSAQQEKGRGGKMDEALPATCLSAVCQFDAADANGSQGRRQIKRAWLVMNSEVHVLSMQSAREKPESPETNADRSSHLCCVGWRKCTTVQLNLSLSPVFSQWLCNICRVL